jgi:hypothetical protein
MAAAESPNGHRLVDVLDVHWYPEATGGGVRITEENTTAAVVTARKQAPRSLWDPTYTETSWITGCCSGGPIRLLPRLKDKITANYPGTRLSLTEYNYGSANHISGAIAQADVLASLAARDRSPPRCGGWPRTTTSSTADSTCSATTMGRTEAWRHQHSRHHQRRIYTRVRQCQRGCAGPHGHRLHQQG